MLFRRFGGVGFGRSAFAPIVVLSPVVAVPVVPAPSPGFFPKVVALAVGLLALLFSFRALVRFLADGFIAFRSFVRMELFLGNEGIRARALAKDFSLDALVFSDEEFGDFTLF